MTLYIVGLKYKTRSHALTIEAEDALIAALKAKHAKRNNYVRSKNQSARGLPSSA